MNSNYAARQSGEGGIAALAAATGARSGQANRLSSLFWYDWSIRSQLLATFILINLVAGAIAAAVVVYNAKRATEVEITASVELAQRFVEGAMEQAAPDESGELSLEALPLHLGSLRHVRVQLTRAGGGSVVLQQPDGAEGGAAEESRFPAWFASLIQVDDLSREIPVTSGGRRLGTITIVGEASDEIAEVWKDMSDLALLAAAVDLTVIALLYAVLQRALSPLSSLSQGLWELEQGRFRHRLPRPKLRELADIVDRFNALAASLCAARADNAQLNRRLVTAQDDERRQIAMELHDELGSCLFGLKANALSLERLTASLPARIAAPVRERVQTLVQISDSVQSVNRRLLRRIRPMALGHVSLAWAVADLVGEFERYDTKVSFVLEVGRVAHSYGDCIDLTVYRCLQEAVTNAVRHADAETIVVNLDERAADEASASSLHLSIKDDGGGISPEARPGLGLTGMQERVRALGGSFAISARPDGGTCVEIAIPLEEVDWQSARLDSVEEPAL